MYNIVIQYFYISRSGHHSKSGYHLSKLKKKSYYSIIGYIPYAVHYILQLMYLIAGSSYLLIPFILPTPLPQDLEFQP